MKVIQMVNYDSSVIALCEDGSMWHFMAGSWHQLMPIPETQNVSKMFVTELDLPPRVLIALNSSGIYYVDQLINKNSNDLLSLPRVGQSAIFQIQKELRRLGLKIAHNKTYRKEPIEQAILK